MTVRLEALGGVEYKSLEKIFHDVKVSAGNRCQHQRFM